MPEFDLRPLSLGEILDRTFTLYRKHFLLFFGIAAIPQIFVLALQLGILFLGPASRSVQAPTPFAYFTGTVIVVGLLTFIAIMIATLFAHGGTIYTVSEIYLGRQITIGEALGRTRGNLGFLVGVLLLNGIVVVLCLILLIIPGIWMACRLLICVPCALIEEKGPSDSLSRSFALTKGFAGRAFMIYLVYFVIALVVSLLFSVPFEGLILASTGNLAMVRLWASIAQLGSTLATAITMPVILISSAIFYYDLRVRKEAFDIQFMMNPELNPPSPPSMPSIL
ncbi:MAG TPA: hypothetical protein VHA14_04625 [Bryobacteraceae bacterium]|nr:hypothetical protein [Bryobacteraceae bacterium]